MQRPNVGDRVRLSAVGRERFDGRANQGWHGNGVVVRINRKLTYSDPSYLDCTVKWANGDCNTYDYEHLELLRQNLRVEGNELILEDYQVEG